MDADRVDLQRDLAAVSRRDTRLAHHAARTCDNRLDIMDDGSRDRSWCQRSVQFVAPIGESFRRHGQTGPSACIEHWRSREAEEDERPVEGGDGLRNRLAERRIARGHVVERAVRLDVTEAEPFGRRDRLQRADLQQHQVGGFRWRDGDLSSPEACEIHETRVSAAGHAVFDRESEGAAHHGCIPGVPAARDVR